MHALESYPNRLNALQKDSELQRKSVCGECAPVRNDGFLLGEDDTRNNEKYWSIPSFSDGSGLVM